MQASQRTVVIVLALVCGLAAGFLAYRVFQPGMPAAVADGPGSAAQPLTASSAGNAQAVAGTGEGATGAGDAASHQGAAPRAVPETVPDVQLPDLNGVSKSLRAFTGQPLIINFWATWCEPCRREIPLLQSLYRAHRRDELQILGVAVDFRQAVQDYLRTTRIDYPLLIGEREGLAAAEQFGMEPVLPFSVFADAKGRVVAVKIGELHREEVDSILELMQRTSAGQISLSAARASIAKRLRQLAVERAVGAHKGP